MIVRLRTAVPLRRSCPRMIIALRGLVPSSPFSLIAVVGVVFLIVSMATRCVLLLQSAAEVDMAAGALAMTFASGLFYDAAAFTYFMVPLAVFLAFAPQAVFSPAGLRLLLYGIIIALFALLVFTACAEYFFWQEFETRFDFVAVDYLVYQREVTENIRQSYPLGIILPAIGLAAFLLFAATKRFIDRCLQQPAPWRRRAAAGCVLLLLPLSQRCLHHRLFQSLYRLTGLITNLP